MTVTAAALCRQVGQETSAAADPLGAGCNLCCAPLNCSRSPTQPMQTGCCSSITLPPQAGELAAALQQSRLGLSQGDVHHLVTAVRSPGGSVEYRPFVSKLWGQLQQQGAVPAVPAAGAGQATPAAGARAGSRGGAAAGVPAPAGAAAQVHLPQFVVARQRRLQTNVALALAQQPEATAREAAELAALPGFLPWKPKPEAQFGKRMAYERPAELGTAPSTTFTFADGDPRAADVRVADVWEC